MNAERRETDPKVVNRRTIQDLNRDEAMDAEDLHRIQGGRRLVELDQAEGHPLVVERLGVQ
ncbi:MAG TPA: hypothetical protein V6D17_11700 [Candidatus Obscuribacterales bacterium]